MGEEEADSTVDYRKKLDDLFRKTFGLAGNKQTTVGIVMMGVRTCFRQTSYLHRALLKNLRHAGK